MSTVSSDRPISPATTRVSWIGTAVHPFSSSYATPPMSAASPSTPPPASSRGLSPGSVLVDMPTNDPALTSDIASAFAVDAFVLGGVRGARTSTLSIFAGGEEAVVQTPVSWIGTAVHPFSSSLATPRPRHRLQNLH
uniref:Probable 3-hydroxyisobutyrate dehydrogenase-like 1, mitochondrial n=1 Tax=Elaeis guineensis var. tenera TaxID=51953 RepID=A0A8N4EYH5_ELAGV|nr:probable 3-hydroxyisobutyrate dehydrogenase-like 1, mitochondrial [Elaeis guineensis]